MESILDVLTGQLEAGTVVAALAGAGAVAALLVAGLLWRRLQRLEAAAAGLGRALERARAAALEAQRQQHALEPRLRRAEDRLGQVELRAVSRPYEQAIRMASEGGSADGLMQYFGLTDGEAALVRLLHGDSRRSVPSAPTPGTRQG
jgi:hypothetical protein